MLRQARAPQTQPFGAEAFEAGDGTVSRWLGMAGFLINSRGETLMVDPLLRDFDMPVMIKFPIAATNVPRLDAVLVTHSDNDHYSVPKCLDLAPATREYHTTRYVASLLQYGAQSRASTERSLRSGNRLRWRRSPRSRGLGHTGAIPRGRNRVPQANRRMPQGV
jgi:hypothetical protein